MHVGIECFVHTPPKAYGVGGKPSSGVSVRESVRPENLVNNKYQQTFIDIRLDHGRSRNSRRCPSGRRRNAIRPTRAKYDVIHKTGSTQRSAMLLEEARATAKGDLRTQFLEDRSSGSRDMLADRDRHTDRQTDWRVDHNTPHPYRGRSNEESFNPILVTDVFGLIVVLLIRFRD